MLNIEWDNEDMATLQEYLNKLGKDALYMNHYELAEKSGINSNLWKDFLTEPRVEEYISSEVALITESEKKKIIKDISKNARSTGTGQTLSALNNTMKTGKVKDGPIFIYNYVPLTENERHAPNINFIASDPFKK